MSLVWKASQPTLRAALATGPTKALGSRVQVKLWAHRGGQRLKMSTTISIKKHNPRTSESNSQMIQEPTKQKQTKHTDQDHSHSHSHVEQTQPIQPLKNQTHSHESESGTHEIHDTQNSHSHQDSHSHSHEESHSHSHSVFHSHTHSQPNEFLSTSPSSIMSNPAVRITWIGLLVNVSMVISKGIGGVYFHSQALIADAIHSVLDMFADFLTLATVNVANKVGLPTNFPLGYGKIETVGSLLVSGVLLWAGITVGWSSLLQVFEYTLPGYLYDYASMIQLGHSHSHSLAVPADAGAGSVHSHSHLDLAPVDPVDSAVEHHHRQIPNINAAWLAGGSIVVKELLFRKTMQVAQETNSKVLVANAWHHRVDSLTALVALLTVTGGVIFNVAWLDSVGGVCVSILIIKAGWGTFKTAWYELVDRGEAVDSELYVKVKNIVDTELENITGNKFTISNLSVMAAGANTNVMISLKSDADDMSLHEFNDMEKRLKQAIKLDDKFVRNVFIQYEE